MLATRIVFLGIFFSIHVGLCHITFENVCVFDEKNNTRTVLLFHSY